LLERLLIQCRRAGIRRVIVNVKPEDRQRCQAGLGSFGADPSVTLMDASAPNASGIDAAAPCVALRGNLVFAQSNLRRALADYQPFEGGSRVISSDRERGGSIEVGGAGTLLHANGSGSATAARAGRVASGYLPYALNGRPEDRTEAELRLAKAVRTESKGTDAFMARMVDRRLSWRLSYRLARTRRIM
jgi:hypothetical protein